MPEKTKQFQKRPVRS